jgi:Protein of unknown function (DUF1353)
MGDRRWTLTEDWSYVGARESFDLKQGEITDLASVPRFLWWFIPSYGQHLGAALVHDHLCELARHGKFSRADADGIFRRILRESGIRVFQRWLMFAAVRVAAGPSTWLDKGLREFLQVIALAVVGVAFLFVPGIVVVTFGSLAWLANRATPKDNRAKSPEPIQSTFTSK